VGDIIVEKESAKLGAPISEVAKISSLSSDFISSAFVTC
jgi:hypothetical protein